VQFKTVDWAMANMADTATLDVAVRIIVTGWTGRASKEDLNTSYR
jgi:hypothetical protein